MARLLRGVEYQIDPLAVDVYPFGFVHKFSYVFRNYYLLVLQVHDVKIVSEGRVTVGKIGIASAHVTALPDVYSFIQAGDIQDIVVGQMDFAVGIRVGQLGKTEFLEKFIVSVATPVSVDEAVLCIQAPVDRAGIVGADIINLLHDPASVKVDVSNVAAACASAFGDVEKGKF